MEKQPGLPGAVAGEWGRTGPLGTNVEVVDSCVAQEAAPIYRLQSVTDRDQLIEQHQHLVLVTIKRMLPKVPIAIDTEDLKGAGYVALVQAADGFDAARGVKFQTWAISKIRGAVLEYLRQEDWVPRSVRAKQRRGDEVVIVRQVSLEAEREGEEGSALLDRLASEDPRPDQSAQQSFEQNRIRSLIRWLPATERAVCNLRYQEGMARDVIAQAHGLPESRVRQIEQRGLKRVRAWIRDRCHDQV